MIMKGNMLGVCNLGKSKETSVTPNAWLNVQMYTHMHKQVLGVLTVIMQIEGKQVASEQRFNLNSSFHPPCFTNSSIYSNLFRLGQ